MSRRIAVLQPAFLGDVVFASPLTRALAERWPGSEIAMLVRPPADEIARWLPGVTTVLSYDKRGADAGLSGFRRARDALRGFAPDLLVSLHESLRTAALAFGSGAPERVGPAGGLGSILYTHVEELAPLPFARQGCALAAALGAPADPRLELRLSGELKARGRALVPSRAVALVPGSEWETKRWPARELAALATGLSAAGWAPVLLGSPAERPLCAEVNALAGNVCLDLCGNRVEEALAVLSACARMVGGDSGLTHAARALGVKTVAIFGPTSPQRHEASAGDRFLSLALSCSPCSDHGSRRCPLGHHRCLVELGAPRVRAALDAWGEC